MTILNRWENTLHVPDHQQAINSSIFMPHVGIPLPDHPSVPVPAPSDTRQVTFFQAVRFSTGGRSKKRLGILFERRRASKRSMEIIFIEALKRFFRGTIVYFNGNFNFCC